MQLVALQAQDAGGAAALHHTHIHRMTIMRTGAAVQWQQHTHNWCVHTIQHCVKIPTSIRANAISGNLHGVIWQIKQHKL